MQQIDSQADGWMPRCRRAPRLAAGWLLAMPLIAAMGAGLRAGEAPDEVSLSDVIALSAVAAEVKAARLQLAGDESRTWAERMALLPRISLEASGTRQSELSDFSAVGDARPLRSSPYNSFDARIRVGQAILDFPAMNRAVAAGRQAEASRAGLRLVYEQSAETAAKAWLALMRSQAQVVARTGSANLAERLLVIARERLDAGVADALSVSHAASQLAASRTDLATAEQQRVQAALDLAIAVDLPPSVALRASGTIADGMLSSTAPTDPDQARAMAQRERAELAVSLATIERLDAQQRAEVTAHLPNIEAFGDWGVAGPETDLTERRWTAGVRMTIILVDGSDFRGSGYAADRDRERLRLDAQRRRVHAEVESALAGIGSARDVLKAAISEEAAVQDELRRALSRFQSGPSSNADVVDAQRSLQRAEESLVDAYIRLASAHLQLARSVGCARTVR